MNPKKEFIAIFKEHIHRDGADKLLEYLMSERSDFFTAPASTKFHGDYDMGLVTHSVNVYYCLKDYLSRARCLSEYKMNYSDETIALVALLHDVCKINCYHKYLRNVKNEEGVWEQVAAFNFEDPEPFGHGEKSVFLISKFLRLTMLDERAVGDIISRHISSECSFHGIGVDTIIESLEANESKRNSLLKDLWENV